MVVIGKALISALFLYATQQAFRENWDVIGWICFVVAVMVALSAAAADAHAPPYIDGE